MASERINTNINEDFGFSSQSYNDDIENIREMESEVTKSESGKIGIAGIMALAAAMGLIITGTLQHLIETGVVEALQGGLVVIGVGAAIYGGIKTLRKVFGKSLDFPSISAHRKVFAQAQNKSQAGPFQTNNSGVAAGTQTFAQNRQGKKELRRSRSNRVFSGVAGGLADYLGISPALVRFGFVAAMFGTSGMFFFLYLLLTMVLPKNYDEWRKKR